MNVNRTRLAMFARDVAEFAELSENRRKDYVGLCDMAHIVERMAKYSRTGRMLRLAYRNALSDYLRTSVRTFLWDEGDPARIIGGYLLAEVLESEAADEEAY